MNNEHYEAGNDTTESELDFLAIMAEFSDDPQVAVPEAPQIPAAEDAPFSPESEDVSIDEFLPTDEDPVPEIPEDIFDDAFFAAIAGEEEEYREPSVEVSSETEPEEEEKPRRVRKAKANPGLSEVEKIESQKKDSPQKTVLLYLHDLAYLLCAILLVFLLVFRVVVVSGDSMNQTLIDGDYLLLLSSVFYQEPKQGDIIVASRYGFRDGTPIVKRVIATEGQKVDIDFDQGIVYVDGVALEESYIYTSTTNFEGVQFPLTVDEGCVFVLGDHRIVSMDSRNPEIGLIDTREILGKAFFLFLPGAEEGENRDFSRFGALS